MEDSFKDHESEFLELIDVIAKTLPARAAGAHGKKVKLGLAAAAEFIRFMVKACCEGKDHAR